MIHVCIYCLYHDETQINNKDHVLIFIAATNKNNNNYLLLKLCCHIVIVTIILTRVEKNKDHLIKNFFSFHLSLDTQVAKHLSQSPSFPLICHRSLSHNNNEVLTSPRKTHTKIVLAFFGICYCACAFRAIKAS